MKDFLGLLIAMVGGWIVQFGVLLLSDSVKDQYIQKVVLPWKTDMEKKDE